MPRPLPHARRSLSLGPLAAALLSSLLALVVVGVSMPAPAEAGSVSKVAACNVNLRTSPSVTARLRTTLKAGTSVTVATSVTGGYWRSSCGSPRSSRYWYRISAINGRSVKSLYGVTYLYGAYGLFKSAIQPVTKYANCPVRLRTSASTSATILDMIPAGTKLTVATSVTGTSSSTLCAARVIGGSYWYRISAINGMSVSRLYGVSYVYAPAGLFTSTPPPSTPPPVTGGANLADYGGNWSAAMEAAKSHGNVLYVPAGTWPAPRIFPYAGLTIRGAGAGQTVVTRSAPGALAAGGFFHVSTSDVTIADLTLRGWPISAGLSDDILIYGLNARRLTVQRVNLENPQGVGLFTEGTTTGGLFEDITVRNVLYRSNGYHGVGVWAYKGSSANTYRRITIDGVNYSGIMIDAGTTGSTDAASVNDNVFEDIVIRHAARQALPGGGGMGAGWMFTGGARNVVRRYEITDQGMGAALAFGADQSGIGSSGNSLTSGTVLRISSTDVISLGGGATGNTFNGGTGGGHVVGSWAGNTITNWPGLIY